MPIVGRNGGGTLDVTLGRREFATQHASRDRFGKFVASWFGLAVVSIGSAELAERIDHEVEALALDELHRVVVQAVVLAKSEAQLLNTIAKNVARFPPTSFSNGHSLLFAWSLGRFWYFSTNLPKFGQTILSWQLS